MNDEGDQVAWRYQAKKGPTHGFLKGSTYSLCAMAIWLSVQDNVDPDRKRCGLCLNVLKARELKP